MLMTIQVHGDPGFCIVPQKRRASLDAIMMKCFCGPYTSSQVLTTLSQRYSRRLLFEIFVWQDPECHVSAVDVRCHLINLARCRGGTQCGGEHTCVHVKSSVVSLPVAP